MSNETSLAIMTRASQMLAEATTVQRAKELKDLALTAKDWATRKKKGDEVIQNCRYYALMAERKMGEMLKATERAKGGNPKLPTSNRRLPVEPTLADIGVSRNESSHAQKLAEIPEAQFQEVVSGTLTMAQVKKKAATHHDPGPPPDPNAKIKDENGKVIPKKLHKLWFRKQEIQTMLTQISHIKSTCARAQDNKDPLYAELNFNQVAATAGSLYTELKSTMPYCVCPLCQGEGCRACEHRGLIGKFRYDTSVPKELKK